MRRTISGNHVPRSLRKVMESNNPAGMSPVVRWFVPRGLQLMVMKKTAWVSTHSGGMWKAPLDLRMGRSSGGMLNGYQMQAMGQGRDRAASGHASCATRQTHAAASGFGIPGGPRELEEKVEANGGRKDGTWAGSFAIHSARTARRSVPAASFAFHSPDRPEVGPCRFIRASFAGPPGGRSLPFHSRFIRRTARRSVPA